MGDPGIKPNHHVHDDLRFKKRPVKSGNQAQSKRVLHRVSGGGLRGGNQKSGKRTNENTS